MAALVPGSAVMTYKQLRGYQKLPPLPLIILYEVRPRVGHWVIVLETPLGLEHFDSYGLKPDGELELIPTMRRHELGEDQPHLVRLLLDTNLPINFSDGVLQGKGTATCGRWCALRYAARALGSEDFLRLVAEEAQKRGQSPDAMVASIIR